MTQLPIAYGAPIVISTWEGGVVSTHEGRWIGDFGQWVAIADPVLQLPRWLPRDRVLCMQQVRRAEWPELVPDLVPVEPGTVPSPHPGADAGRPS
jgi:hypothetical protein